MGTKVKEPVQRISVPAAVTATQAITSNTDAIMNKAGFPADMVIATTEACDERMQQHPKWGEARSLRDSAHNKNLGFEKHD
jgi:hypothetical protein